MSTVDLPIEWKNHDEKVRPYLRSHRWIGWASSLVSLFALLYLLYEGHLAELEACVQERFGSMYLQWLAYFAVVGLGFKALKFPFSYASYWVERKYELSKQKLGAWLWDDVKGTLVGGVLGTIVLGLLCLCVAYFGRQWWIPSLVGLFSFSILMAQLAPVLLIPLFFKLKPMEDSPLKQRLLKLCQSRNVCVEEIYHLGMGEKTEKGNAAFTGLGRTKRIMIGDTLYEKFPEDQVEAVFAHELGHQVHNDLWKGMGLGGSLLIVVFYLSQWIAHERLFPEMQLSIAEPYGLLWFFIIMSIVDKPFSLLQTLYSRNREWAADDFASREVGLAKPLGDALERLTFQNWGYFKPNALVEFFTHSHPAPWRRILALRK